MGLPYGGVFRGSHFLDMFNEIPVPKEPRLVAIKLKTDNDCLLVLNVYMPTNSPDNIPDFLDILGKIEAVASDCDITNVLTAGDFNCHPMLIFANELLKFCQEFNYSLVDLV